MSLLRKALIVPPIAAGAAILYLAVSGREPPARTEIAEAATVVRVLTATPIDFIPRVLGYGTVEPARTLNAISQVSGRVTYINPNFKRGDFVNEGDILATLSTEDYELEIAEARSDIASADVDLEEIELTLETTRQSLTLAASVLELAQRELQRLKTLQDRNVASDQQVENQEASVLQRKTEVQNLENEISLIPVKRKALQQAREKADVRLRTAELNLKRTAIRAPFDARVSSVNIEFDQFVSVGTSIGELDGIDASNIDVQISPKHMAGFANLSFPGLLDTRDGILQARGQLDKLSATVRIGISGVDASWQAQVKRVSDTVDPNTRSVGVIVSVDEPYATSRPGIKPPLVKGMFAEVELAGPAIHNRTVLPRNAVANGQIMTVTEDNRLKLAEVSIAYHFDNVVVLNDTLSDGTQVIVSDVSPVIAGMLLVPVEDKDAAAAVLAVAQPKPTAGAASQ